MARVDDVAAYILQKCGPMSAMKLQKLVYYSQAWHLVWDEEPLFEDRIEAWANGPVVPSLYAQHRGQFILDSWSAGDPTRLKDNERQTVDAVIAAYGKFSAQQLSELSHREQPWMEAREGLSPTQRSTNTISAETMQEYYSAVAASVESAPV